MDWIEDSGLKRLFRARMKLNGYTGLKIHPVRMVGSNESGQSVSMVPVTEPKLIYLTIFLFY